MNAYNPYATSYFPNYAGMTQPVVNNGISYTPMPQMEIQKVNGEESAKAYPIGPNSSVILLDTNNPLVWVVTTDASGYKTVNPFKIEPYTPEEPISNNDIKTILDSISTRLNVLEEKINDGNGNWQSNNVITGEDKSINASSKPNGGYGKGGAKPDAGNKPTISK